MAHRDRIADPHFRVPGLYSRHRQSTATSLLGRYSDHIADSHLQVRHDTSPPHTAAVSTSRPAGCRACRHLPGRRSYNSCEDSASLRRSVVDFEPSDGMCIPHFPTIVYSIAPAFEYAKQHIERHIWVKMKRKWVAERFISGYE